MSFARSFPSSSPRVYLVLEKHFATAQGWGQLALALRRRREFTQIGFARRTSHPFAARVLRRLLPRVERLWLRVSQLRYPQALVHFPWGDAYVDVYAPSRRQIATLHQPYEKWRPGTLAWCRGLGGVHTLTEREAAYLRREIPGLPVRCILHGIDVQFWRPGTRALPAAPKRIVFTGYYMRNVPMFFRVIRRILEERPEVEVELLLNPDVTLPPEVLPLPPRTRLVGPFNVEELRAFLQSAWLMFMPYDNVTASNSVCEALACGLPVFTTRVGGMESYAIGGMVLVDNNNDDDAVSAVLRCLDDPAWRAELSTQARDAAVAHLDWDVVVAQLDAFYADTAAGCSATRTQTSGR